MSSELKDLWFVKTNDSIALEENDILKRFNQINCALTDLISLKSTEELIGAVYDIIFQDKCIRDIALFHYGRLVRFDGEGIGVLKIGFGRYKNQKEDVIVDEQNSNLLFFNTENGYSFGLQSYHAFYRIDIEYYKLFIKSVHSIRKSKQGILENKSLLTDLFFVYSNLQNILYIKADAGYGIIKYEKICKDRQILNTPLKTIEFYFNDSHLIKVHRSYLINPNKNITVSKSQKRKFKIHVGEHSILIGKTYLKPLRKKYPEWFLLPRQISVGML